MRASRAAAQRAGANRLPEVTAGFTASGRDTGEVGAFVPTVGTGAPVGFGDDFVETYDLSAEVGWQADLFGRLRRLSDVADLQFAASRLDRVAIEHAVVASVVRGRVAVATLDRRVALARENVENLEETLDVVEARYEAGIGDPVELRLARENVESARAVLPPIEAELAVQRFALAVLLGGRPGALGELADSLPPVPALPPPPAGLPVTLLDRRPDLLASEFRVRADKARVGAALADLFPDVRLSASGGFTSDTLGDLLDGDALVYSVVGAITGPVFDFGRRRANVREARAVVDASAAEYAGDVLQAMREVSEAYVREAAARREADASQRCLWKPKPPSRWRGSGSARAWGTC